MKRSHLVLPFGIIPQKASLIFVTLCFYFLLNKDIHFILWLQIHSNKFSRIL